MIVLGVFFLIGHAVIIVVESATRNILGIACSACAIDTPDYSLIGVVSAICGIRTGIAWVISSARTAIRHP